MVSLSPIILFVYNRPWHIGQTVEALQKNELYPPVSDIMHWLKLNGKCIKKYKKPLKTKILFGANMP